MADNAKAFDSQIGELTDLVSEANINDLDDETNDRNDDDT